MEKSETNIGKFLKENKAIFNYIYDSRGFKIGVVVAKKNGGIGETFTVRKLSSGVGVERTFPINSPLIDKITVIRVGKVRRAKLYYLRSRSGKSARIKEVR